MSPFNSTYLTQNYHSKYIERSSGKTSVSNQWHHLMFVKWKYDAHKKIGVKVDRFLKVLLYKIRNFLTSGLEIYAIWVECLVNKLSQIIKVNSGFILSSCNPNKVREMVTYLGTHLFINDNSNVCTMLLKCVGF